MESRDKKYSATLDGNSVQLQVSGMGLVAVRVKTGQVRTFLFQSLLSWAGDDTCLELWTVAKEKVRFGCVDGEEICQSMSVRVKEFMKGETHGAVVAEAVADAVALAATHPRERRFDATYNKKFAGSYKWQRCQLQVGGMGLHVLQKDQVVQTHMYQSMQSWGDIPATGIEVLTHEGYSHRFTCEEGDTICVAMQDRVTSLVAAKGKDLATEMVHREPKVPLSEFSNLPLEAAAGTFASYTAHFEAFQLSTP
jgi:hypothetical protein